MDLATSPDESPDVPLRGAGNLSFEEWSAQFMSKVEAFDEFPIYQRDIDRYGKIAYVWDAGVSPDAHAQSFFAHLRSKRYAVNTKSLK